MAVTPLGLLRPPLTPSLALPFCILHSAFYLRPEVAWDGFARLFKVRGSRFGSTHKHPESNSSLPPPPAWSGGTLDKPWTCPGTIDPLPDPIFDQSRLSKSVSRGSSARSRYSALDVGDSMFDVGCSAISATRCGTLTCVYRLREMQGHTALHDRPGTVFANQAITANCVRHKGPSPESYCGNAGSLFEPLDPKSRLRREANRLASRLGELVLELAMHITAMLVLLHGPEE